MTENNAVKDKYLKYGLIEQLNGLVNFLFDKNLENFDLYILQYFNAHSDCSYDNLERKIGHLQDDYDAMKIKLSEKEKQLESNDKYIKELEEKLNIKKIIKEIKKDNFNEEKMDEISKTYQEPTGFPKWTTHKCLVRKVMDEPM